MEGRVVIIMVFSGLCFLPTCVPRDYFLIEKAKTWSQAESYCRQKYTNLATVENQEEMDTVKEVAERYFHGHVWIGLHYEITGWKWSLEEDSYYAAGEKEFRMWESGESNQVGHDCVGLGEFGLWNSWSCSDVKCFVCSTGTTDAPSFVLVKEPKTWRVAQSYCRQQYTDLASVRSQAENDQIRTMLQGQHCWIGLYRGQWKWTDGTPMSYRQWNPERTGDVNTQCGLAHRAKWEAETCARTLFFVCYLEPVRKQVVEVKVTQKGSSGSLEDAAETILQQMSQRLKDHGLSKDTDLKWMKQPDGKVFVPGEEEEKETEEISCRQT